MKPFLAYLMGFLIALFAFTAPVTAFAKNFEKTAACKNSVLQHKNWSEEDARHLQAGTLITYEGRSLPMLHHVWGTCTELTSGMPASTQRALTAPTPAPKAEASKPRPAKAPATHVTAPAIQRIVPTVTAPVAVAPRVQPHKPAVVTRVPPPVPAKRSLDAPTKPVHVAPAVSPKENKQTDYTVLQKQARQYVAQLPWQQQLKELSISMSIGFTDGFTSVIDFLKHWQVWGTGLALLALAALFLLRRRIMGILSGFGSPPQEDTGHLTIEELFPGSADTPDQLMRDAHVDHRSFVEVPPPEDIRDDRPTVGFALRADDSPNPKFDREHLGGVH